MADTSFNIGNIEGQVKALSDHIGNVGSTDLQTQITELANKATVPYKIITDLNISDTYGLIFTSYKPSNAPITGNYVFVGFMIPYDINNVTQIVFLPSPAHLYIRQRSWGTWGAWTTLI